MNTNMHKSLLIVRKTTPKRNTNATQLQHKCNAYAAPAGGTGGTGERGGRAIKARHETIYRLECPQAITTDTKWH